MANCRTYLLYILLMQKNIASKKQLLPLHSELTVPKDTDLTNDSLNSPVKDKHLAKRNMHLAHQPEPDNDIEDTHKQADTQVHATENLDDHDFPEEISDEDKETIKKVASDDNLSQAKSYASILVEQVMHAKETFDRSLGSLFTSALTAGLEIGISFFMILAAFALLTEVMPNQYAMVLSSLLYPIGFIIVVIGHWSIVIVYRTNLAFELTSTKWYRALKQTAAPLGHCYRGQHRWRMYICSTDDWPWVKHAPV